MSPPNNTDARSPVAPGPGSSLNDWLGYLESIHPTEIDLGLDRVLVVFRRLFRQNPKARIITVAGTNGKGSTVFALERMLGEAGRSIGAYTSPHLSRYNERVRINGADIDDAAMVRAFESVESARRGTSLTYFEFGTLAAFVAFQEVGVQDWVLEVGLGGRLDAVNILDADIAIITSIDLDHQAYLGNDRETIGFEKAGILRPNQIAIFADDDPPRSVLQQAAAQNIRLLRPGDGYTLSTDPQSGAVALSLESDQQVIELPGDRLPVKSLAAASVAMRALEPQFSVVRLQQALHSVTLPGRFERLSERPLVIADVGHNPHAARWLSGRLASLRQPNQRVLAVYAALADKDVEGVASAMLEQVDHWFLAGLDVPRGLHSDKLTARISGSLGGAPIESHPSVPSAVSAALEVAEDEDIVLIFGSFFTVAEGREVLARSRD